MPQIARPKQYTPAQPDVSQGLWTPTPIYPNINALNFDPNDQKFVTSGNVTGDTFEDLLSGMAWPDLTNPLETLTVRLKKTDSASIGATIKLMQGATLIAFLNVHPTTSFANYVLTLTQSQISVITNYADLRVRVTAGFITVQVPCCPNPVPEVLNATITGGYSLSFALLYNSTAGVWNGTSGALCNNPTNWALKCL